MCTGRRGIGLTYNKRTRREGPAGPEEQQALEEGLAMTADQALELALQVAARVT
jgi:hypothetical protein